MSDAQRSHVDRAVELLERGKLAQAAAEFEKAVRLQPGNLILRQRLGDVYLRAGMRTHAIREFQHVAGRYAAEGQLLRAIAFCKVILEVDPQHQETLHALADLYGMRRETMPFVSRLPSSMTGALPRDDITQPEANPLGAAPTDIDLESLIIFRDALAGVPLPPATERDGFAGARGGAAGGAIGGGEDTLVDGPRAVDIDLRDLPPSPLFSRLSKDAFQALVQKLDLRWMTAGETLVREGEQGDSMFVVVQGVVNVMHRDRVIAAMAEGSFFGEMALITDAPRLATVVAARDGLLFEIHRARMEEIALQHPSVGEVVAAFYRERMLANVLRASPVFRPLNEDEKSQVGERFVRHSLPPQTVLLEQGKPGAGFCVLLRGKCDVFHVGGRGEQTPLPQLREGDIFGEISLLLDGPCTATVRTASFCEVLELPRDDFRRLVLPNPEVREMVKQVMHERITRTADLLEREHRILPDYVV